MMLLSKGHSKELLRVTKWLLLPHQLAWVGHVFRTPRATVERLLGATRLGNKPFRQYFAWKTYSFYGFIPLFNMCKIAGAVRREVLSAVSGVQSGAMRGGCTCRARETGK